MTQQDNNDDLNEEQHEENDEDNDNEQGENPTIVEQRVSRSDRAIKAPSKLNLFQKYKTFEHYKENEKDSTLMARIMQQIDTKYRNELAFIQQYSIKKEIAKFGEKGLIATQKEAQQLHDREAFEPICFHELTYEEKKSDMESLTYIYIYIYIYI